VDGNNALPKELSDSERLKILENEASKIGFWAWFLIGGLLIFVPVIGPVLFGIWTIFKVLSLVNRKEIRKSYGIDKYGVLREVDF